MIPEIWGKQTRCCAIVLGYCLTMISRLGLTEKEKQKPTEAGRLLIEGHQENLFVGENAKSLRCVQIAPEIICVSLQYSVACKKIHTCVIAVE